MIKQDIATMPLTKQHKELHLMSEKNRNKEQIYCMEFSNNDIYSFFITKFRKHENLDIRILADGDKIDLTSKTPIEFVCFDGEQEDFFISFLGYQTSIFIQNQEIMFIDDSIKNNYTTSDIYDNIVYEGQLSILSKEEILSLMAEIVECFIDAVEVQKSVNEEIYNKKYRYYKPKFYEIWVKKDKTCKSVKCFENLKIRF